jgi:hypothetical protein
MVQTIQRAAKATKTTPKRTHYYIANSDNGDVIVPQPGKGTTKSNTIVFPSGQTIQVDIDTWNNMKELSGVRNFINAGILKEVKGMGQVAVSQQSAAALPIPPNLQREEEIESPQNPALKAQVKRKNVVTI